ncbi:hypothetical protein [Cyanobacterium aponinum]|uniref:hypothetical protein n=1 Tax=Cyanobacterium aponinum TaxID=379064 RepID=UPI000C12D6EB|nr:hypothetical protein [Cyanobacterium aponinum]PHV60992.1 hypothetical protein CSQ80_17990 [Cyanobacterium aponinum IPPAS B-1201]
MSKKLVDLEYEELKAKLDEANKNNNYQKILDYSVALSSKFCYHMDLDKKWMLNQKLKEIDEIIASIDEKRKDRDMLIAKLNEVKSLTLEQLEAVKKQLKNYK